MEQNIPNIENTENIEKSTTIDELSPILEEKPSVTSPRIPFIKRRSSFMGIAPALSEISRPYGQQVRSIYFWYTFRRLWRLLLLFSVTAMFVIPYNLSKNINGYLLSGGSLSIASCLTIVFSYYQIIPWRRHPSSLILHKSLSSLVLSIILVSYAAYGLFYESLGPETSSTQIIVAKPDPRDHTTICKVTTFFTELSFYSGECWMFFLSIDLFLSLTNPFTSYTKNMTSYHMVNWIITFLFSFVLTFNSTCQGVFLENGMCWIKICSPLSGCLWAYLILWVGTFYWISFGVVLFAYIRLTKGLESTYATRKTCVQDTFSIVFIYLIYLCILVILYLTISDYVPNGERNLLLKHLLAYLVACRGTLDSFVWFSMHDFKRPTNGPLPFVDHVRDILYFPFGLCFGNCDKSDDVTGNQSMRPSLKSPLITPNDRYNNSFLSISSYPIASTNGQVIDNTLSFGDFTASNSASNSVLNSSGNSDYITDLDLSPQLNIALRKELLHFVTMGIKRSVERFHEREKEYERYKSSIAANINVNAESNASATGSAITTAMNETNGVPESRGRSVSSSSILPSTNSTYIVHSINSIHPMSGTQTITNGYSVVQETTQFNRSVTMPILGYDNRPSMLSSADKNITSSRHFSSSGYNPMIVASKQSSYRYGPHRSISTSLSSHLQRALSVATDFMGISHFPMKNDNDGSSNNNDNDYHHQSLRVHPLEDQFYLEEKYLFKDFYPEKFRYLRQLNAIDENWYVDQLIQPTREILQHRSSGGSSGSFMFYSNQGDYIVKTLNRREANVLIGILDQYIAYIATHTNNTLLCRFLGLHSVTLYYNIEFIFIVMKNIFPRKVIMNEKYDIKGSWVNRNGNLSKAYRFGHFAVCKYCSEVFVVRDHHGTSLEMCMERMQPSISSITTMPLGILRLPHEASVILKDNDFTSKLRLNPNDTVNLYQALYNDSDALCAMGITDYSLLIGIHYDTINQSRNNILNPSDDLVGPRSSPQLYNRSDYRDNYPVDNRAEGYGIGNGHGIGIGSGSYPVRSLVAPVSYHFGIIDILQTWTIQKQIEKMVKVHMKCLPVEGISCMPPEEYRDRFQNNISKIIDTSSHFRSNG